MMAAATTSCRVVRGSAGLQEGLTSAVLPLHSGGVKMRRPVSYCNGRVVGARFGGCLRTAGERSESMAVFEKVKTQFRIVHWQVFLSFLLWWDSRAANASVLEPNTAYGEIGAGLEFGVQLIYLGALLALLGVGSFLVVRQVLIRRELESAAKDLQDRVRSGEASSEEFFELGAVMLRKKYYVLANKYLEQAIKKWYGDEADLAQVYNALGFSYFSDNKLDAAINQYEKALKLQPGYVTAWNNLGNVYELKKDFKKALKAYEEALQFDPRNKIAQRQRDSTKERVDRFQGIPTQD